MKILLNPKISTPLNEQIRLQILRQIADGTLSEDECLPSIRLVARELGIGIITVKTAYEKLESDGVIYTVAGKGCFVKGGGDSLSSASLDILRARLGPEIDYARSLGVTKDELIALISSLFDAC